MRKLIDLTGKKFGKLTVIKRAEDYVSPNNNRIVMWLCKCDCGNDVIVQGHSLKSNNTQSCGCLAKENMSKIKKKYNTYDLSGEYGIGYTSKGEEFYFDLEDYDKIKDYCWCKNKKGYILTNINIGVKRTSLLMHNLIMDCPKNMLVDHKNGSDSVNDNRKYNLRIGTQIDNMKNRKDNSNNKSGYKGVIFHKQSGKWLGYITNNKKRISKLFDKKEDAISWRQNIERELFGDWSYNNRDDVTKEA